MSNARREPLISEAVSAHLDLLRGLAAIAVVFGHLRYLFFTRYADLAIQSKVVQLFYFLGAFGHVAVVLFFVLSGFWISSGILRRSFQEFSPSAYGIQRLSRLYTVLIPALLLGALVDGIGIHFESLRGVYTQPLPQFGDWTASSHYTLRDFIGNLFFLQYIRVQPFGSNAPLWSLSYEFWYYVLFPLNLFVVFGGSWRSRGCATLLSIGVAWFLPKEILSYYWVWLLGVLAFFGATRLPQGVLSFSSKVGIATSLVLMSGVALVRPFYDRWGEFSADAVVALLTAFFLFVLLRTNLPPVGRLYRRVAKGLASFSFTLYLVHMPLLVLFKALLAPDRKFDPGVESFSLGLGILVVVMLLSYGFSWMTERHTDRVRRWCKGLFGSREVGRCEA